MTRVVVLDAGPIGLVTNPRLSPESIACSHWLQARLAAGDRIVLPEIADYEVRRELLRAGKTPGLIRLDALAEAVEFLPITTIAMRKAAQFWAIARQSGRATAGDQALDADVILAAQAATIGAADVVIATTNLGHLSRYTAAALWADLAD